MDIMEKVEVLREKAGISYEEAKKVLEEANGDLLDAMVILEHQSKIRKPETELIKREEAVENTEEITSEEAKEESSKQTGDQKEKSSDNIGRKVKSTLDKVMQVLKSNSFRISRKRETLFMMPAWVLALILLFVWETVIPIMLIALLFKVRYSFVGTEDMASANEFMDKVGSMAEEVVDGIKA